MLNKRNAEELFFKEAVLIGNEDAVPAYRAVELFGQAAVDYGMKRNERGRLTSNIFGLGDGNYSLKYLYKEGFLKAVSWANVEKCVEKVKHTTVTREV